MAALPEGAKAPEFTLPTVGDASFDLRQALAHGPVLMAFFKISCPVCQFALPYIERIQKAKKNVTIIGISQNDKKDTMRFMKEYGLTMPVALDDTGTYPVSNAYGLTNVPTLFWIGPDGSIEVSSVGWAKQDVEEIYRRAISEERSSNGVPPLFRAEEQIPAFRAG